MLSQILLEIRASCMMAKTGTQVIVPRPKKRGQDRACLFPRKCVFSGMRDRKNSLMEGEFRTVAIAGEKKERELCVSPAIRLISRDRTREIYLEVFFSSSVRSFFFSSSEYSQI